MKGTDRAILLSLTMVGLLAAFYFLALAPKRDEASQLSDEITELQASVNAQERDAALGEQARKQFPRYYSKVVVLGKAVPEQADTASMLVQLDSLSEKTDVDFRAIALAQGAGAGTAPAPAPAPPPESGGAEGSTDDPPAESPNPEGSVPVGGAPSATEAPAAATETTAATLPIGATVGPAGLPTLPYELAFEGTFFDVADFLADVDGLVHSDGDGAKVAANGRLLTVDGFVLKGAAPDLQARFALTSYTTPSTQGLTLGATPGGPAPAPAPAPTLPPGQPETTPAAVTP